MTSADQPVEDHPVGNLGSSEDEVITADLDEDTRHWLTALGATGRPREEAISQLHRLLLRVAYSELRRRRGRHPLTGPELDDLAHQATSDAVVALLAKLDQFRGESRFTTWAYKFAVLEVSAKLGRHFWQRPDTPMGDEDWGQLPDRFGIDPADHAQRSDMVTAVRQAVDEVLTPHQRQVFVAIVVDGVPLDALVVNLGSNRNAIYKTMFDARRKLRDALVANGYLVDPPDRVDPRETTPGARRP